MNSISLYGLGLLTFLTVWLAMPAMIAAVVLWFLASMIAEGRW